MTLREEKILAGIKYFVKNTRNVGRTKLYKLLYFWDFEYFKKYGMTVTGYQYYTFPFGPVPKELSDYIQNDSLPDFLNKDILIIDDRSEDDDDELKRFRVKLKKTRIDTGCLSPNELNLLHDIAYIYKDALAKEMTEISHLKNQPWDKTKSTLGMGKPIDYFLAIDETSEFDREEIEERFQLQKDLIADGRY